MQGYVPRATVATGYAALDQLLPGGGWPLGSLIEIISQRYGLGELSLFVPALRRLSDARQGLIIWIAPRFIPYAPALQSHGLHLNRLLIVQTRDGNECLWAAEQALRSACCVALLAWPEAVSIKSARRLQLAAEEHQCLAVLFRSDLALYQESSAALRLQLVHKRASERAVDRVRIIKCRGAYPRSIELGLADFDAPVHAGGAA